MPGNRDNSLRKQMVSQLFLIDGYKREILSILGSNTLNCEATALIY
ncbi:hypothetical protein SAMN05216167_11062 [Spirosoma endophyticum]|uniref:Uncharacterized protein n=1 Tax=Spirosoma endophyticum TaxID=662367 RepID=A0A1I1XNF9_9BACT|nr:hypothetical protein SAMN05216167_11062 [Spirosoma endophyticum]